MTSRTVTVGDTITYHTIITNSGTRKAKDVEVSLKKNGTVVATKIIDIDKESYTDVNIDYIHTIEENVNMSMVVTPKYNINSNNNTNTYPQFYAWTLSQVLVVNNIIGLSSIAANTNFTIGYTFKNQDNINPQYGIEPIIILPPNFILNSTTCPTSIDLTGGQGKAYTWNVNSGNTVGTFQVDLLINGRVNFPGNYPRTFTVT